MVKRVIVVLAASLMLGGCTSIFGFGGGDSPRMAYVGDLAHNRTARAGETIAYSKTDDGENTIAYIFKGVDSKGGIHILRMVRPNQPGGRRTGFIGALTNKSAKSVELVYLPEQTLLVSPGVHVVFIRTSPGELQYRVVMT
jgi:hypothetical protein